MCPYCIHNFVLLSHPPLGFKAFPMLLRILHKYYFSWLPNIQSYAYHRNLLLYYYVIGRLDSFPRFCYYK